MVKIVTAIIEPINLSGEFARWSHPKCAAQLVTAGALKARNPAITPIRKATRSTCGCSMAPSLYASRHFVNVVYLTGQVQVDKLRYTLTSVDAAGGVERLTRYIHPAVTKLSYKPAIPYWLRRPLAGRFCS